LFSRIIFPSGFFALRGRAMNAPVRGQQELFECVLLICPILLSLCFHSIAPRKKSKSAWRIIRPSYTPRPFKSSQQKSSAQKLGIDALANIRFYAKQIVLTPIRREGKHGAEE
jgi:hypothetical protein